MFLKYLRSGDLVEVMDTRVLFDPCETQIQGRFHSGEEMQDVEAFSKADLIFPSGEALPKCWINPNYRS